MKMFGKPEMARGKFIGSDQKTKRAKEWKNHPWKFDKNGLAKQKNE